MKLILNNPYRILGLLVGATAREQTKQVSRLRQYIEAEQKSENDYSFESLGEINRTISTVDIASSHLNLNEDKMSAALFWFYNGKPITDEVALEAINDGDFDTAYQIWDKLIVETTEDGKRVWKNVTEKNYSAFHNIAVLCLVSNKGSFLSAVMANIKFIESEYFNLFVKNVVDETYSVSRKEIQISFLKIICESIENKKVIELVKYLNDYNFLAKADYLKVFFQNTIEKIERKIQEVTQKSKANKAKAGEYGNELYNATKDDFTLIKSLLSKDDFKVINVADKLAEGLLNCSITVFNHFNNTETMVSKIALDLINKAKIIAIGSLIIARIDKNKLIIENQLNYEPKIQNSKLDQLIEESERPSFLRIILNFSYVIIVIGIIIAFVFHQNNKKNNENSTYVNSESLNGTTPNEENLTSETTNDDTPPIESKFKGNQLQDGASPLTNCFGKGIYGGNATLTIKNGGNSDAIICLYSIYDDRTIRNEYVQKNSSFTMSNIAQGDYKIRVFYGNDWNPNLENSCGTSGNFESDVNFSEFDGTQYFQDSGGQYSTLTITLYSVEGGNASSSVIDQSQFFKK